MDSKSWIQIIKGFFTGDNNEGSSKRMLLFWFTVVIFTSMSFTYCYCYYLSVVSVVPTTTQLKTVSMFEPLAGTIVLTIMVIAGFTNIPEIIKAVENLICLFKGNKKEENDTTR